MEDFEAIDILVISVLFVLLIVLGILAIFVPTNPAHDSARLYAISCLLIAVLGYRFLKS